MNPIETFEAMLAQGQDNEMLRFSLGNACFSEKQYGKAIEHLRRAVALKPDYSAAWRLLGRALAADGQLQAARDVFDEGERVAEANGDKQTAREIVVFRKRVLKVLAS